MSIKNHILSFVCLLLPLLVTAEKPVLLNDSLQMMLVLTEDWNSVQGKLFLYERSDTLQQWKLKNNSISVVVGKNGMGWEKAIHREILSGPMKKEGDLKAPAGVATLGTAFGFSSNLKSSNYSPYLQLSDSVECVDDKNSKYYNQIVDADKVGGMDWNSSEKMKAIDVYKVGLDIGFNVNLDANNSCVFMHIWRGSDRGTAGCTAMQENDLNVVLNWLDNSKKPVLVQLPKDAYKNVKDSWVLPSIG